MKQQGLEICFGFLSTRVPGTERRLDFGNLDDRPGLIELAESYAEFLDVCDPGVMVTALGIRANADGTSPRIVDFQLAETIAGSRHRPVQTRLAKNLHPCLVAAHRREYLTSLLHNDCDPLVCIVRAVSGRVASLPAREH